MSDNKGMSFLSWSVFVVDVVLVVSIAIGSLFVAADSVSARTFYQLYDSVLDEVVGTYDSDTKCRLMERQLGRGECIPFEMNIGDEEDGQEENVTTWKLIRSNTGEVLIDGLSLKEACVSFAATAYPNDNVQCVKSDTVVTPSSDSSGDTESSGADGSQNSASKIDSNNIGNGTRGAAEVLESRGDSSGPQSTNGYVLLEPSILVQGGGESASPADYLENIFYFMIGTAGVLAVLVFAIGGIQFMLAGTTPSQKKDGQEKMTAAIFGLILALGAWLILNTINPDLVKKFDLKLDTVTVTGGDVSGADNSEGSEPVQCNAPASHQKWLNELCEYSDAKLRQEDVMRKGYQAEGIAFNNPPCTRPTQKRGCTDIVGLKSATDAELLRIARAVGGVTLTGGTEVDSHAISGKSHPNGYKFDLRLDPGGLDKYIADNFTKKEPRSCKHTNICYRAPSGAVYYKEHDHWDVLVP